MIGAKKKRRLTLRRKRSLDPNMAIDYKQPDTLKRFITERGKIIPRRISGATQSQQRQIALAVKRARYLALIPFSVSHRTEKGFAGEMSSVAASMGRPMRTGPRPDSAPGHHDHRSESSNDHRTDSYQNEE